MEVGQLIIHNMRNIFLKKSFTKSDEETMLRPFSKKSKFSISLDQDSKVLFSLFVIICQVEGYRNILKLNCRSLAFTSHKAFFKNKKMSGTSIPATFSARFPRFY